MRKPTVIESFCGPGGLGLGLSMAGFDIRLAFDAEQSAVDTHNLNLGGHCRLLDATAVTGDGLLALAGTDEVDLFAGGPPCQGFSKQRKGAEKGDKRNLLVLEYLRLVREIRPRYFLFENVAVFGTSRGKEYVKAMTSLPGYDVVPAFYDSSRYGLAQKRVRFIAVGRRMDVPGRFTVPPPVGKPVTVGEVLAGLPEPPLDHTPHPDVPNHVRSRVSALNIERFSHVPQGGGWPSIPFDLRMPCHQKADPKKGGWPDVFGRLEADGLCPTVTGGFDSFTRGRFGHPFFDRPITAREAARLQGFPDSYVFTGNRGQVRKQIGNAVPPPLGLAVGRNILSALAEG